ncbi:S-adenosyl-L-methionine-dependent methyltransferase [Mucidula mucida]|nr:S-adenosyl-L-methionine-dependent methyltransferase [Mucidula mucida]
MRSKRRKMTAEDIEVCFLVDGVAVLRTDPLWTVEESLGDLKNGILFTFLFRVKKTLPKPPSLPRPPATARQREDALQERKRPRSRVSRFERRGDCGVWSDDRLLGWVSLRSGKEQCVNIKLFNLHVPPTLGAMTFGSSTKANEVVTIVRQRTNLNMKGIDCLKSRRRSHGTCALDVHYVTGNVQWDFAYNDEKSLEVRETRSDIPFVPGVLVRITNYPPERIDFQKFLFFTPPTKRLTTKLGSINLDKAPSPHRSGSSRTEIRRATSIAVVQHLPNQLLITWTANSETDGADSWIVVVRHGLRICRPTSRALALVVDVYTKSTKLDGLTSTKCASWPCQKTKPSPKVDQEMENVDHERSVHGANDLGNAGQNVEGGEQTPENVAELVIPTYDELVAKSSISPSGDETYINVNVRWITVQGIKKKLTAGKSFVVGLQGADGRLFERTIISIRSIRVPNDPGPDDEDIVAPDAPPNELLRICRPRPDPAHFRLSDIVDVHSEAISVADLDGLAEVPEVGDGRFCKWNIVFCDGEKPRFTPVLGCGDTPPALPILEFGEILSGTGSASLGFREAGFNHRFVVEPDVTLASAFSMNSRTAILKESTGSFFSRSWSAQPILQYPFAALLINCDTRNGRALSKDTFVKCIEEFRPAYAVCAHSPDTDRRKLYDMIYKAMKLGYCLKGRVLDCADFGVAAHKKYFVVIACAPGREMPDFPPPKTSVPRTLKDAISDLEWSNATCRPSGKGFATEFPHLTVDQRQALSWHCTGCYLPDVTSWDPDVTVAKWEEPLPDAFLLPSETVKCRHPHHPERFLSVPEMARILGISNKWEFTGSLREQYSQLASAMPPLLSQAIAEELRKVLLVGDPQLA